MFEPEEIKNENGKPQRIPKYNPQIRSKAFNFYVKAFEERPEPPKKNNRISFFDTLSNIFYEPPNTPKLNYNNRTMHSIFEEGSELQNILNILSLQLRNIPYGSQQYDALKKEYDMLTLHMEKLESEAQKTQLKTFGKKKSPISFFKPIDFNMAFLSDLNLEGITLPRYSIKLENSTFSNLALLDMMAGEIRIESSIANHVELNNSLITSYILKDLKLDNLSIIDSEFSFWVEDSVIENSIIKGNTINHFKALNSTFVRVDFHSVDFNTVDIGTNNKFINTRIYTSNMLGTTLDGEFISSSISNVNLSYATIDIEFNKGFLRGVNLSNSDLRNSIFKVSRIGAGENDTNLSNSNLSGVLFDTVNFIGANLEGANLNGTKFINTMMLEVNFKDVKNLTCEQISDVIFIHTAINLPISCPDVMLYSKQTSEKRNVIWHEDRKLKLNN